MTPVLVNLPAFAQALGAKKSVGGCSISAVTVATSTTAVVTFNRPVTLIGVPAGFLISEDPAESPIGAVQDSPTQITLEFENTVVGESIAWVFSGGTFVFPPARSGSGTVAA